MRSVPSTHTDSHSLTSRLSLSVYTVAQNTSNLPTPYNTLPQTPFRHLTNAFPPASQTSCHGVTLGPHCMFFSHRLVTISVHTHPRQAHFPGLFLTSRHKTRFHAISLTCISASLSVAPRDRISGYTHRARPRALTGLRFPAVGSPISCFHGRAYGCP